MELSLDLTIPKGELNEWQIELRLKTLRHYYANALVTYAECGGHKKAERNENLAKQWSEKIVEFGGQVPPKEEAYRWGVFNGEGSS